MSTTVHNFAVYQHNEKGNVALLAPAPNSVLSLEEILKKDIPKNRPHFMIHKDDLPETGLLFIEAWVADYQKESLSIDMASAREVTRGIIRELRGPHLESLDVSYIRASEAEDKDRMREVASLKQLLRDLPASPAIQEAKTPEELEHLARNSVKEAVGE
jgi:dsDNA-binding SOS-regulon protein